MKKIDNAIHLIEKWMGVLLMLAMALAITFQIVFRWLEIQISWTEELARYLFIIVTYCGAVYAIRQQRHLKVEILETVTGEKGKYILRLITNLSSIIFYIILTKIMISYLAYLSNFTQVSPVLKIDIRIIYTAPLLLGVFGLYELIKDTVRVVRTKEV